MEIIDNKRVKLKEFGKWWFNKHGVSLLQFEDHPDLNNLIITVGTQNLIFFLEGFYSNIHSFFTIITSKVPLYYILKNDPERTLNELPIRDIGQLTAIILADLAGEYMLESPDGKREVELYVLLNNVLDITADPIEWTYEKLCAFFNENLNTTIKTPEAQYFVFSLSKSKDPKVREILLGKGTQQEKVDQIDPDRFWEKCGIIVNQNINEAYRILSAFI
jgi:hypothetical protein